MESPGIRIETGTDIASLGLWDRARDAEPFTSYKPAAIAADVREGHVVQVQTDSDGGYDFAVFVGEDAPEELRAVTISAGPPRLLRAPSGRLCLGGLGDYRSKKPRITGERSFFDAPPGDYRVHCRVLDLDRPRDQVAAAVGEKDFLYWRSVQARVDRGCCLVVVLALVGIYLGWRYAWWWALGGVALVVAYSWWIERASRTDARFEDIEQRITEFCGGKSFAEYEEEYLTQWPAVVLELHALAPDEARPGCEKIRIHEIWG